jgi:rhamnulose-1-phosphate aldolase
LETHLAVHQILRQKNRTGKALLHAHVTELIALTQLPGFDNEERLNEVLFGMHPEAASYISGTVGYVGYQLPGTEKLARVTAKTMADRRVVLWEKHGCLAVNQTLTEAFDDLDLLAKSARIYFLCKSAGATPQGLTPAQIEEIRNQE